MKGTSILTLASLSAAFVVPDEQLNSLRHVETQERKSAQNVFDSLTSKDKVLSDLEDAYDNASGELENVFHHISDDVSSKYSHYSAQSKDTLNEAVNYAQDTKQEYTDKALETCDDVMDFIESTKESVKEAEDYSALGHHGHHGHHHKPNQTVYELIASSKYTTKLAKLVNEFPDLVEALNGTAANFTVFAPTDRAFEKIPDDAPKPSKEYLKALLSYHVSPEFYPAGRVLVTRTIPTLLKSPSLGKKPLPQRLATEIGLRGLTVNYITRIVAVNIFGTNGVIHGVDSLIIPPFPVVPIIDLLPTEFSTLELGLGKTGLLEKLNSTGHPGGTFFAPSNFAFQKLGPRINAFLFSQYGRKYLKALLEYHVVGENTLYSDAFYKNGEESKDMSDAVRGVPKGVYHVDLPTMLEGRSLGIDIGRYGRLIEIKINGFARVSASDVVAYDGVIHVVGDVIIPPKKLANGKLQHWDGKTELSEEDLMERLAPAIEQGNAWEEL